MATRAKKQVKEEYMFDRKIPQWVSKWESYWLRDSTVMTVRMSTKHSELVKISDNKILNKYTAVSESEILRKLMNTRMYLNKYENEMINK